MRSSRAAPVLSRPDVDRDRPTRANKGKQGSNKGSCLNIKIVGKSTFQILEIKVVPNPKPVDTHIEKCRSLIAFLENGKVRTRANKGKQGSNKGCHLNIKIVGKSIQSF